MPVSSQRILVIDDQEVAKATINAVLGDEYCLDFAPDGDSGLLLLSERRYDLILCDIVMPRMDGYAVCATIARHPDWQAIPVILVSARDTADDIARGLDVGAVDYITRPFDPLVLRARVRAALRTSITYSRLTPPSVNVAEVLLERRRDIIRAARLTEREEAVLELILVGRSHQDIAEALNITARTSKFHLHNVLAKLNAESRSDLLRIFA